MVVSFWVCLKLFSFILKNPKTQINCGRDQRDFQTRLMNVHLEVKCLRWRETNTEPCERVLLRNASWLKDSDQGSVVRWHLLWMECVMNTWRFWHWWRTFLYAFEFKHQNVQDISAAVCLYFFLKIFNFYCILFTHSNKWGKCSSHKKLQLFQMFLMSIVAVYELWSALEECFFFSCRSPLFHFTLTKLWLIVQMNLCSFTHWFSDNITHPGFLLIQLLFSFFKWGKCSSAALPFLLAESDLQPMILKSWMCEIKCKPALFKIQTWI